MDRLRPLECARFLRSHSATGVPAHISHYNGRADVLLPMIDEGRALGLDLTFDTYPYLAGSTILGMIALPPWVQEGGVDATVERLHDPAVRARLRSEWFAGGIPYALENVAIGMVANADWRWAEGQTVAAAASQAGLVPGRFRLRNTCSVGDGRGHHRVPPGRANGSRRSCDSTPPRSHGGI